MLFGLILIEGLVMCFLLLITLVVGIANGPIGMVVMYEKDVQERAIKLEEFKYINVYILSKEDIAVSKIIRLAEKDIEDLNQIIPKCDKKVLNNVIDEVLNREDLFDSKRNEFVKKLKITSVIYV